MTIQFLQKKAMCCQNLLKFAKNAKNWGGHWNVWGKSIQFLQKKAICRQNLLKMLKTVCPRIDRITAGDTPKGHEVATTKG